ncbi:uncharacterized protein LOC107494592 isoform X1 [Arachis duranensis]|uniref:Uncharacterized protein LOC107494592 isoform X1 n=1 Tax=Arachis duranensis TaxID=130453 RepID=A0A6P4DUA9_ARADU|nr:uncharacterized protein LOC107494592 isoform X1 [Arachis duranensis]XP_025605882.1 uncharacterized protein LOC112697095 [Arachis hypogaea]QHO47146.1 uncharacterized protein DS421_6g193830 [Arachis hypogaea]
MTPPASFLLFPWSRTLEKKSRNSMDPPSFKVRFLSSKTPTKNLNRLKYSSHLSLHCHTRFYKEIISRSLMEQKTINFSLKKEFFSLSYWRCRGQCSPFDNMQLGLSFEDLEYIFSRF